MHCVGERRGCALSWSPRSSQDKGDAVVSMHQAELQDEIRKGGERHNELSEKLNDLTIMLQSFIRSAESLSAKQVSSLEIINTSLNDLQRHQGDAFEKLIAAQSKKDNAVERTTEERLRNVGNKEMSSLIEANSRQFDKLVNTLQEESKGLRQIVESIDLAGNLAGLRTEVGHDIAGLRSEISLMKPVTKTEYDIDADRPIIHPSDVHCAIEMEPESVHVKMPEITEKAQSDLEDEPNKLRLDRKRLTERLELESNMESNCPHYITFVCLLLFTLVSMASYDPVNQVAKIHHNLKNRFQTINAKSCSSIAEIMTYTESFLDVAYDMAPALVDANTMNSIDFARCFDKNVNDICGLTYWYLDPRRKKENTEQVLFDALSPKNGPSVVDCPGHRNCLHRKNQTNPNLTKKTRGLTPEDPIIYQSRREYDTASIVPMTPIMWQTRAKPRPCSGFGNRYNHDVLGAGHCSQNVPCNPDTVTAFDGTKVARSDKREQTYYLTYSEDVFQCVDRNIHQDVFFDSSWHPWASFEDFNPGKKTNAVEFDGKKVFFKFASDVSYLQKPVPESVILPDNIADACPSGPSGAPYQNPLPSSIPVSDPLLNPHHGLWKEAQDNLIYSETCSLRKLWSDAYLQQSLPDRANGFITIETTELTLAVMVLTPQSEAYADVQTLIRVVWTIDQGGSISAEVNMQSTSQTDPVWFVWVGIVVAIGLVQLFQGAMATCGCYSTPHHRHGHQQHPDHPAQLRTKTLEVHRKRMRTNGILDVVAALLAMTYVGANFVLEMLPPDVTSDLLNAFKDNSEHVYFEVFKSIVVYNQHLYGLKQYGYFVICLLFVRFVLYLVLHPRMAVLVNTLAHLGDKFYHFMLYFMFVVGILAFLGWWMFAEQHYTAYGTLPRVLYTQFQMFTGTFPFPPDPPSLPELLYLLMFTMMVFIILVNFLLAIVVGAYQAVDDELTQKVTNQNVNLDVKDVSLTWIRRRLRSFPSPKSVLHTLDTLSDTGKAYVTGEILFNEMQKHEESFKNVEHAESYLDMYATKIQVDGESVLRYAPADDTTRA